MVEVANGDNENPNHDSLFVQIRKILYDHIKTTTAYEMHFFMDQEKMHKRDLVDLMRRIDNGQITSENEVIVVLRDIANKYQSETLNDVLQLVTAVFSSPNEQSPKASSNKMS